MDERRIEIVKPDGGTACWLVRTDGVTSCRVRKELGGDSYLEFSFLSPVGEKFALAMDLENRIRADGREYSVIGEDAVSVRRGEDNAVSYTVTAREAQYLLQKDYKTISNDPGLQNPGGGDVAILSGTGAEYWVNGAARQNPHPVGSAAYALYCLLDGTGWTLGVCDVPDKYDLETRGKSTWENIERAARLWGGILVWDSIQKTVSLRNEDGYQEYDGFQIRYRKNQKALARARSLDLVTRLYPYGEGNLSIKGVNGGREYLEDFSCTGQVLCGRIENSDIREEATLLQWAGRQLKKLCRPRDTYSGSAVDLSKVSSYRDTPPVVGHLAEIVDDAVAAGADRQRIISLEYDFYRPWEVDIEIGERADSFVQTFVDWLYVAKKADGAIDSGGNLNGGLIRPGTYPELNRLREEAGAWGVTVKNEMAGLSTTLTQTAAELRAEAKDLENSLTASVSLTAEGLRAEMKSLDSGLTAEIAATARELRSEFRDDVSGLSSRITQNAREITAQAGDIRLLTKNGVTFTDLRTAGSTVINGANITTGSISASRISGLSATIESLVASYMNATTVRVRNLGVSGSVDANAGDFSTLYVGGYRVRYKTFSSMSKSDKVLYI